MPTAIAIFSSITKASVIFVKMISRPWGCALETVKGWSGPVSTLKTVSFTNQPTQEQTVTTAMQMIRRRRSSSRCSTIVISLGSGSLIARILPIEAICHHLMFRRARRYTALGTERRNEGAAATGGGTPCSDAAKQDRPHHDRKAKARAARLWTT